MGLRSIVTRCAIHNPCHTLSFPARNRLAICTASVPFRRPSQIVSRQPHLFICAPDDPLWRLFGRFPISVRNVRLPRLSLHLFQQFLRNSSLPSKHQPRFHSTKFTFIRPQRRVLHCSSNSLGQPPTYLGMPCSHSNRSSAKNGHRIEGDLRYSR